MPAGKVAPNKTRTNITIEKELKYQLEEQAKKEGRSFNNLVINKGLTEARALDILDEKGLAKIYLDIYTYIK